MFPPLLFLTAWSVWLAGFTHFLAFLACFGEGHTFFSKAMVVRERGGQGSHARFFALLVCFGRSHFFFLKLQFCVRVKERGTKWI